MPSAGIFCGTPSHGEVQRLLREQRHGAIVLVGHGDHREHHLEIAVGRGAQQRPDLHPKNLRARQRQPDAAQAEERVALFDGEARHRLVAAGIDGADGDRLAAGPFQHLAVGRVLRLLVRQAGRLAEQEFGAHQPDAVAGGDIDRIDIGGVGDIDLHADRRAGVGGGRAQQEIVGAGAAGGVVMRGIAEPLDVGGGRAEHDAAMLGVEQRDAVDLDRRARQDRRPSARRASGPAWRHGLRCCRRSARCRRRGSSRFRGSGSARCRRRTGWRLAGSLRRRHRSAPAAPVRECP